MVEKMSLRACDTAMSLHNSMDRENYMSERART